MATLSHPNIIRMVGVVLENPNICMVMELAREGTLKDYLLSHESLDWQTYKRGKKRATLTPTPTSTPTSAS